MGPTKSVGHHQLTTAIVNAWNFGLEGQKLSHLRPRPLPSVVKDSEFHRKSCLLRNSVSTSNHSQYRSVLHLICCPGFNFNCIRLGIIQYIESVTVLVDATWIVNGFERRIRCLVNAIAGNDDTYNNYGAFLQNVKHKLMID